MVGVEVDVGQELEQDSLGGLHHPVGDRRGHSGGPRRPTDPLYFALEREKDYARDVMIPFFRNWNLDNFEPIFIVVLGLEPTGIDSYTTAVTGTGTRTGIVSFLKMM